MIEASRPAYAIEARNVAKSFGSVRVLHGISLGVADRETLVVLGPNGAGKTTLLKVLATIMRPSSGEVLIGGLDPKTQPEEARRRIGVITHEVFLYGNLTTFENLQFYSRVYDVPEARDRIHEVVELVGMTHRLHDRVGVFSRGMLQRLSIARALLHRPAIMLLDEPDTGLDQQALELLWKVIKGQGEEKRAVIVTTHSLERALDLGDRFLVLCQGEVACEALRKGLDMPGLTRIYQDNTVIRV